MNHHRLSILGTTNWRQRERGRQFGMLQEDRLQHLYVIGQTGTGKTTLLTNLMLQDIAAGRGIAFLDPHGDAVEGLVRALSPDARSRLIYLNVPDPDCQVGFNPIEAVPVADRPLLAAGLVEAFRNIFRTTWGPRLEHILRNALLTLLDQPSATLADLPRLFLQKRFREEAIEHVTHATTKSFWEREFDGYVRRGHAAALAPLFNKFGAFLSQPPVHRFLTRARSSVDIREAMDEGRIVLVNLAKGKIGEDGAALLGSLILTRISVAALGRTEMQESARRPFFVYLDEFQTFTTLQLASMLSELRKYGLGLILSHQFTAQVDRVIFEAVLGNVGSIMSFRIGVQDAMVLRDVFAPDVSSLDLAYLPNHHAFVRLLVAGEATSPFSARTFGTPNSR